MHMDAPLVNFRRFFQSVEFCVSMAMHLFSDQKSSRCIWCIKNGGLAMNEENWSRPKGAELDENRRALRGRWVVIWIAIALMAGACLGAGLFIGWKVYGGGL